MGISLIKEFANRLIGRRIELTHMPDDPYPVDVGSVGEVEKITPWPDGSYMVRVRWHNITRALGLVCPPDEFRLLD